MFTLSLSLPSHEKLHHDTPGNKVEGYPIMFFFPAALFVVRSWSHFSIFKTRVAVLFLHVVIASCPGGANFASCFYLDYL